MNSEQVESWHGISFHPHSMCQKVERVTAKTGCTSCTKWTISFEVSWFRTKVHLLERDFIFGTYLNSRLFVCSLCTIRSHAINFQPFLTSFAIFLAKKLRGLRQKLDALRVQNEPSLSKCQGFGRKPIC